MKIKKLGKGITCRKRENKDEERENEKWNFASIGKYYKINLK